jgi:hypothetical protein
MANSVEKRKIPPTAALPFTKVKISLRPPILTKTSAARKMSRDALYSHKNEQMSVFGGCWLWRAPP